jgi:hypothetical protein
VRPSLAHLLVLSASQDVKFEFLVKSRVYQVKEAMTYSMKSKFEEGKEKELQNVAVMEKFKDNDINAMSIVIAQFVARSKG